MTIDTVESVASIMNSSGVAFGTSGARGLATAMTDRVCYSYTRGFLSYLAEIGEFHEGDAVALAGDLRPSTPRIMTACANAVLDAGGVPVNCGLVPTPALAFHAMGRGIASLMVTGSHIPADRNGIKFYRPHGEVLKTDEVGMMRQEIREAANRFKSDGALAAPHPLPAAIDVLPAYTERYVAFFGSSALAGRRIGVYQHSAVGRDVLVTIFEKLGADVTPLGRSDIFIPVDTEAVRPEDQVLAKDWARQFGFDAIASTDGDSDRPLLADRHGEWLRGDVLGILCADATGGDYVVTPVSSNTALEKSGHFKHTVRTRIGSPYVIAAMDEAIAQGYGRVCGYEANGGFLLASSIERDGATMTALATRDAVLPIVAALVAAGDDGLDALVAKLPARFTYSDRIQNFAQERSKALLSRLSEGSAAERLARIDALFGAFAGPAEAIDLTDGLRYTFRTGQIAHLRASGNAPELRCYTEADDEAGAKELNAKCLEAVLATV